MYFAVICFDRPGTSMLRTKTAAAHLRYLVEKASEVHTGGPLLDPKEGGMVGSLYVINVTDYEAARRFIEGEPLNQAGLFESITIRGWTQMQPEIKPGANEATAAEFDRLAQASGK